ncbi:MAG TPA: hypothetical protein VMT62_02965, partial [Syntrophorhabdaceae bacterium]|nr:hypothetical protein [Syntrophorhabdaceae bacterium]
MMSGVERSGQELRGEVQVGTQRITKKKLVDSLNCINFMEEPVIVHLEHIRYGSPLFLRAYPRPCSGETLECTWVDPCPRNIGTLYKAKNFMIDKGLDLLIVDPQASEMNEAGVTFVLPEECRGFRLRRARRYASEGIQVTLMQDAATFSGILDDFTMHSFRVLVSMEPPQTFDSLNEKLPLYMVLSDGKTVLYTGECSIIRQTESKREHALVLEPTPGRSRKDKPNGDGHMLAPPWSASFRHPLASKRMSLEVDEISSRWFSVLEYYESAALTAGLVIPTVELEPVPGLSLVCSAQVSSGIVQGDDGQQVVKWWMVITDMSVQDQGKLFAFLQKLQEDRSHAFAKVDLEDLLTFFFDAGFVYPKKYETLHMCKERFRETYEKLYLKDSPITRHFIEVDKGVIHAHLSMIRFYENTW